ncbi:uncharacterized protein M6B38_376035 [Iris pallida]|uniref:Secreted protein n=1 Tax=Iris pallida TaxID=29817 RepID=A0AAX6G9L0_IRIPA|nr:uncharacterized protein M6B38_376035 [Iris pallida]
MQWLTVSILPLLISCFFVNVRMIAFKIFKLLSWVFERSSLHYYHLIQQLAKYLSYYLGFSNGSDFFFFLNLNCCIDCVMHSV